MNTKVQNLVYTKQLLQRLNELRSKLNSRITGDNVKTLSASNVVSNEDSLTELQPTNDAVICNADMRHVLPSINFLRANKYEFKTIEIDIDLKVDDDIVGFVNEDMKKHTLIKIPDGYDGLSSFVFVKLFAYAFGVDQNASGFDPYHTWAQLTDDNRTISSVEVEDLVSGSFDSVFIVNKSRRAIYVDVDMVMSSITPTSGYRYLDSVKGYILLWRRI